MEAGSECDDYDGKIIYKVRGRKNTLQEKRGMRARRKKRKRAMNACKRHDNEMPLKRPPNYNLILKVRTSY